MDKITQKSFDKLVNSTYSYFHYASKAEDTQKLKDTLEIISQNGLEISQIFYGVSGYYNLWSQKKVAVKFRVKKSDLSKYAFITKVVALFELNNEYELVEIKTNNFFYFTLFI